MLLGHAAQSRGGFPVQDVIAIGSPGMDVDNASSFEPAKVWAGRIHDDDIGLADGIAGFGTAPVDPYFSATVFNAEQAPDDPSTNHHNDYFDYNSHGLANMANIVTGNYQAVEHVQAPDGDGQIGGL